MASISSMKITHGWWSLAHPAIMTKEGQHENESSGKRDRSAKQQKIQSDQQRHKSIPNISLMIRALSPMYLSKIADATTCNYDTLRYCCHNITTCNYNEDRNTDRGRP